MKKNLRYVLFVPLCAGDFYTPTNLFDSGLNCPRANRTNLNRSENTSNRGYETDAYEDRQ